MDVARVNFSHGTADDHRGRIAPGCAKTARRSRRNVAVLADLPGAEAASSCLASRAGRGPAGRVSCTSVPWMRTTWSLRAGAFATSGPAIACLLDDGRLQSRPAQRWRPAIGPCHCGGHCCQTRGSICPTRQCPFRLNQRDRDALAVAAEMGVAGLPSRCAPTRSGRRVAT